MNIMGQTLAGSDIVSQRLDTVKDRLDERIQKNYDKYNKSPENDPVLRDGDDPDMAYFMGYAADIVQKQGGAKKARVLTETSRYMRSLGFKPEEDVYRRVVDKIVEQYPWAKPSGTKKHDVYDYSGLKSDVYGVYDTAGNNLIDKAERDAKDLFGNVERRAERNVAGTGIKSEHAFGRALDIYVTEGNGDEIVEWAKVQPAVRSIIYNERIYMSKGSGGWADNPYSGRHKHKDHVHVGYGYIGIPADMRT